MSGSNSLHYCYEVSYQCWFASDEAKIYCNNFNSSNAVVCSHLILAYTVRLAMINAAEMERNGCFSLPLLRNVVLWLKRTSTKSLQIELWTGRGGGDPNPRRVQIHCDTGAKCPWFLVMTSFSFRSVLAVPSVVLDEAANLVLLVEVIWSNG